jgi:hypothetical protein
MYRDRSEFRQVHGFNEDGMREWVLAGIRTYRILLMIDSAPGANNPLQVSMAEQNDQLGIVIQELYLRLRDAMPNQ